MNTDDRELLELAAKAAGIEYGADRIDSGLSLTEKDGRHRSLPRWNPLEDDGDALRLAVKLRLKISIASATAIATHHQKAWGEALHEDLGDDHYAATRRAIVRAAAEIGLGMP